MSIYKLTNNALSEYFNQREQYPQLATSHLHGMGAVAELEEKLRNFYKVQNALCVDSCTSGLMYVLMALGLAKTEIITTPLTYGGTIAGALHLDSKFHFADVDSTLNISPLSVEEILKSSPNVKAVIAVDFGGCPHNMFEIKEICDRYGVWYIVDCAQSMGAEINDFKAGSFGDVFVNSFSEGKTINCCGGGAIMTDNTDLYNKLVAFTQHPYRIKRDVCFAASSELALNGRIHPLSAVIGNAIFEESLCNLKQRQAESERVFDLIEKNCPDIVIPSRTSTHKLTSSCYHTLCVVKKSMQEELSALLQDEYYCRNNAFELLPDQLSRMLFSQCVQSAKYPYLNEIKEQIVVLNKKS